MTEATESQFNIHPMDQFIIEPLFASSEGLKWYSFTNQALWMLLSVFVIGAISGLVASPCTTAPLSGALLFIAQSGDIINGAAILYALSLGMGVPLILFGLSGGKLLPKAGAWMVVVKQFFVDHSQIMIQRIKKK